MYLIQGASRWALLPLGIPEPGMLLTLSVLRTRVTRRRFVVSLTTCEAGWHEECVPRGGWTISSAHKLIFFGEGSGGMDDIILFRISFLS